MYLVSGKYAILVKIAICKKLDDSSRFIYKFKYRCKNLKYENMKILFFVLFSKHMIFTFGNGLNFRLEIFAI